MSEILFCPGKFIAAHDCFVFFVQGESCLRTDDILKCIEREGENIALIFLSGVQYYTGQLFEIEKITKAGHSMVRKYLLVMYGNWFFIFSPMVVRILYN